MKRPTKQVFHVLRAPDLDACRDATEVVRRAENPSPVTEEIFEIVVTKRRWSYCREFKRVPSITLHGRLSGFQTLGLANDDPECYTLYFECENNDWKGLDLPTKKFAIVITHFDGNVAIKGYIDQNDPHSRPA